MDNSFEIISQTDRSPEIIDTLTQVWEDSVRNSHDFLQPEDIELYRPLVKLGLSHTPLLFSVKLEGEYAGFMGISDNMLDMLFLNKKAMGRGIGSTLVRMAVDEYRVNLVDVNEQNERARAFYQKMGFESFDRKPLDDQGRPYPILNMKLKENL